MNKHTVFNAVLLSAILLILLLNPNKTKVYAKEYKEKKTDYDIFFVLDVSASMKETDKNRNSIEIIKMMIDMCTNGRTRIGFTAYNDTITSHFPLADVSNTALRNDLKKVINDSAFSGYTDMGLGLRNAIDSFSEAKDINNQPIIILLSDGETDLSGSKTGRTNKDSKADISYSIKKAQKKKIPIYTIGLTDSFNTNLDYLKDISSKTGAISYTATSTYQLVDIFNGILSENINSVLTPVKSKTATGKKQYFDVDVADESLSELNIMLFSDSNLEVYDILSTSPNISMIRSKSYQLIKVLNPVMETIRIAAKDTKGANIQVATLGVYSFTNVLTIPDKIKKQKDTELSFHFYDTLNKTDVKDETLYKNLNLDFYIKDVQTGEETKFPAKSDADGFHFTTSFEKPGKYKIRAEYSGETFFGETKNQAIEVTNAAPIMKKEAEYILSKQQGTKTYDISNLFKDADKDPLTFKLVDKTGADMKVSVSQALLTVTPLTYGETVLTIKAQDTAGASSMGTIRLHAIPIWQYYHKATVIIIIAVIVVTALFASIFIIRYYKKRVAMPKPFFTGCLVGYFLSTTDQTEIPPLKWQLNEYPNKGISLSKLFKARSIELPLPEAEKIWFSPKVGNSIEIIHSTSCTILVGTQNIQRNTPATIHIGEKLYIAFEDMNTELEIRYKNA